MSIVAMSMARKGHLAPTVASFRPSFSAVQQRWNNYFMHLPPPPPKEYLPDGTPKKYPLNQPIYNHKYNWEEWHLHPAGVFHTMYLGEFAKDRPWRWAFLRQYPLWVSFPMFFTTMMIIAHILFNFGIVGKKPKRYTVEWMSALKERERAENTNPITRYLDRRRAERGPHFLLSSVLPYHPYFMAMRNSHDYEAAEMLLARREKDAELLAEAKAAREVE